MALLPHVPNLCLSAHIHLFVMNPIWTFLPGLHGNAELFSKIQNIISPTLDTEFIELPSDGEQDYTTLSTWLNNHLPTGQPRLIIAESFSGPLALRIAKQRPEDIAGIVLVASFCSSPINPSFALLAQRPLFMVKPPSIALRHFLTGSDADENEVTLLRNAIHKTPASILISRIKAVLGLQEQDIPILTKTPILILQAQRDQIIPWDAQQRLEASYPNAKVYWIDAPHLILQHQPKQCLVSIQRFLASFSK